MLLIAVCWHRYGLLEGDARPGIMRPGVNVLGSYFVKLIIVGLLIVLAAVPGGVVMVLLSGGLSGGSFQPGFAVGLLATLVLSVVLSWIGMRISLILPAAALGTSIKVSQSWQVTESFAGGIFRVAIIVAVLNGVLAGVAGILAAASPALAILGQFLLSYFQIILSISVLSTLYGHLVQGRPLT